MQKYYFLLLPSLIFSFWSLNGYSEWGKARDVAAFSRVPQAQNEKAIVECLDRLKGFISSQETTNLDNLKTKIERIYGLKQSKIQYRELFYKNQAEEKWRVEFYLIPDSPKGKEKYRLKFYKLREGEGYSETLSPEKEEVMDLDKMLKFGHAEEVETDERWERFDLPKDPTVNYKVKNFKAFELSVALKKPKTSLVCNMAGGHPFCQCTLGR